MTGKKCAVEGCGENAWDYGIVFCLQHALEDLKSYFGPRGLAAETKVPTGDSQLEAHAASGGEEGHAAKDSPIICPKCGEQFWV